MLEGGLVGCVVEAPDGSGKVETCPDGSWVAGGPRLNEFFTGTEPSVARLQELGISADCSAAAMHSTERVGPSNESGGAP